MSQQEEVMTENDISETRVASTNTSSAPYDRKRHSKAIRVLTVLAYVLSVSLAAIILSIYYIFVWEGHPTLAGRTYPQPDDILDSENLQTQPVQNISRKRDTSIFLTGNESNMMDNDVHKGSVADDQEGNKCKDNYKDKTKEESQNYSKFSFFNNSGNSTVWMVLNSTTNLDEFGARPRVANPTMDYEDSTYYTTPPSDENSTWFSELDDFNSDYGILNKRSVFLKKLIGHHNMKPK